MTSGKSGSRDRNSGLKWARAEGPTWIGFRRTSQVAVLILFILLFLFSKYPFDSTASVDDFFKVDPLVALLVSLGSRAWVEDVGWSLSLLLLAIFLGRFFCGWVCPLGTTLDAARRLLGKKKPGPAPSRRGMWVKYAILVALATSAFFSVTFVWFFDPISTMIRSMTLFLYPLFSHATTSLLEGLARFQAIEDAMLGLIDRLRQSVLPVYEQHFEKSLFVAVVFITIGLLEKWKSRFWCRYVCPLGALYGLLSRKSVMQRIVDDSCTECGLCERSCRMAAIGEDPRETSRAECIYCLECSQTCPEAAIRFGFARPAAAKERLDLTRRRLITSGLSGALGAGLMGTLMRDRARASAALRPPGALPEDRFVDRCVRCFACVRVCSTSGGCLQPSLGTAGIEAILTPVARMRQGYCEYNCNLCSLVCPTGAIHELDIEDKKKRKMGLAAINRNKCIPWIAGEDCIVCEEHCPVPEKAIKFDVKDIFVPGVGAKTAKLPYIVPDRCIGCGICETKCPVTGEAAIVVTREGEERWL
jgi:polyferredoxin